ncbi:hypothetical protein EB822_00470 [Flavobacteriaceae bacterium PRS1]|nr:hypothetical protein EB822_00470 [Flavobacteriaceae bacterium PRS1]
MFNLKELLTFECKNEYESAYDLSLKRSFSNPKIYSANGDLKKRWYVYFSFREPDNGKLKRLTPFYGNANKYKTKEERLEVLVVYRKTLLKLLKQGYNPYADNSELYHKLNSKEVSSPQILEHQINGNIRAIGEELGMTLSEAFDFEAQNFQLTRKFKRAASLDITAISLIFYIHCCANVSQVNPKRLKNKTIV